MRKISVVIIMLIFGSLVFSQAPTTITLNPPDLNRGLNTMQAFSLRASASEFDTTDLSIQDLSDLLWAANGINRPGENKRTAPSSRNSQDIDVYVTIKEGIYFYNAAKNQLELVVEGDHRNLVAGKQDYVSKAPVICIMVSDISRFPFNDESMRLKSAAFDAAIVSENISIFCASVGLATRCRASMEQQKLRELLKLKDTQLLMLNNPVSYIKK